MIIQLNNEGYWGEQERHFDCDWLSAFPEESERLFMGGRQMLQLESVRVVETNNNYGKFLRAFNLFDVMLSGRGQEAKKLDVRIVRGAVCGFLDIKSNDYHQFVNDTFCHFCARKTQVILDLMIMDRGIKNQDFVALVMNEVKGRTYSHVSNDDVNLFKPVLFELFGNLQELVLTSYTRGGPYAFNLRRLSHYAFPKSLRRMRIEAVWLRRAFTDSVQQSFSDQGWKVKYDGANTIKLVR